MGYRPPKRMPARFCEAIVDCPFCFQPKPALEFFVFEPIQKGSLGVCCKECFKTSYQHTQPQVQKTPG